MDDDLLRRCLTAREYAAHQPIQLGQSGAGVVFVPAQSEDAACFVKIDRANSPNSLRREHDVLLIRELGLARESVVPDRYRRMVRGLQGDRTEQG